MRDRSATSDGKLGTTLIGSDTATPVPQPSRMRQPEG